MIFWKRFTTWFRGPLPETLFSLARRKRSSPPPSTASLYVLRVDFPLKADMRDSIQHSLQPLKDKFGIDFLLLEPGISVKRFDDI